MHGVSGPPGQAERFKKRSGSLGQVHVCSLSLLVIYWSVKIIEQVVPVNASLLRRVKVAVTLMTTVNLVL